MGWENDAATNRLSQEKETQNSIINKQPRLDIEAAEDMILQPRLKAINAKSIKCSRFMRSTYRDRLVGVVYPCPQ